MSNVMMAVWVGREKLKWGVRGRFVQLSDAAGGVAGTVGSRRGRRRVSAHLTGAPLPASWARVAEPRVRRFGGSA